MRSGLLATLMLLAAGCADIRYVVIRANPADAVIKVNGEPRGKGPINERLVFNSSRDIFQITASRLGYRDLTETITQEDQRPLITLDLRPQAKRINIRVEPAPAIVMIDGAPLSIDPVSAIATDAEFGLDPRGQPVRHTIRAERENFLPAERSIAFSDTDSAYLLTLEPMKKTVTITSDPPGADIFLDGKRVGISPVMLGDVSFAVDLETNNFVPRTIRAALPGYEAAETPMSWDGGKTAYPLKLGLRQKQVRLILDPPDATVKIDGQPIAGDPSGLITRAITFAPVNTRGDLQSYNIEVSKKTDQVEYEPKSFVMNWDNGQIEYRVSLKLIPARQLPELSVDLHRTVQGWQIGPQVIPIWSYRDIGEGASRPQAQPVLLLPPNQQLGSFTLAPDGSSIVYSSLSGSSRENLRSRLFMVPSSGQGEPASLTDGQSLDMMPAFTPNGDQVVFSSTRGGKRLNVWSIAIPGGALQQLTKDDGDNLWPALDRDPKPRLFYETRLDTRADPQLYFMSAASPYPVDLTQPGGMQPRISPRNDAILFCAIDSKSGKYDIFRASTLGNAASNLTKSLQANQRDPCWSREGRRIVFASDRATDDQGWHNYDIWMINIAQPDEAVPLTVNGSLDDCPVFDALSDAIYFRSNRGGRWGIWKINIK